MTRTERLVAAFLLFLIIRKFNYLEDRMSETDDKIQHLDAAATETGARIGTLTTTVRDLVTQLAAEQADSDRAAELQQELDKALAAIDRNADYLHQLAADPANPVPDVPAEADPGTDGPLMEGDPTEQQV